MIADEAFTLVTSKEIVKELYRVLLYPHILKNFKPSKNDINEFITMILERADITKGLYEVKKIKEDPTDNMFLACAMEGKADYIVSRDLHLRNLKHYRKIQIVDPKTFADKEKG
jgi:putative PIN family toxin of toxin-antitoxin system